MSKAPQIVANEALAASEPHFVAPELIETTKDGPRLVAGRCKGCGALSFPKAPVCTECLGQDIETTHLARTGKLYSYSVVHQAPKGWDVPYALGYVDLEDCVRVLAHIEGDARRIGMDGRVTLGIAKVGNDAQGAALMSYVFTAAGGK